MILDARHGMIRSRSSEALKPSTSSARLQQMPGKSGTQYDHLPPSSSDFADRHSQSDFFDNWETPQLVIHSEKDFRLPVSEGLAAFNVLQSRGVESQFLHFPDENHWVLKPENSLVWHKTVLNFINRHAGLPPYTEQSPDSDEYYGGIQEKTEAEDAQKMPTQGQRND